ncbi:hypothetical protein M8C21_015368 [Ambrosia artemisiifolia]|uniref:non-specific serine/threonine protein kinase n=1 Tax=Ambrosia artemisiifolia TaxID=4212 RepID=A0AAD5C0S3_AMBAR|nr:hypothetical protein M8C21_015368 [Ambrosia artemisiifolia]
MLLREANGAQFTCGFQCEEDCTSYIFSIFISPKKDRARGLYRDVWSANPHYPVKDNAILNFTADGELVLKDGDGSIVWTTNTAGKAVAGMNLTDTGNLVLFDDQKLVVWQSFDHPTNSLLHGQKLFTDQKLKSSVSLTKSSGHEDMYSLRVTDKGLFAYVESNPPQAYFSLLVNGNDTNMGRRYLRFLNGSLSFFIDFSESSDPADGVIGIPPASSAQYLKLKRNGHLKVHEWHSEVLTTITDLTENTLDECSYPLVCGRNSICATDGQCSCPRKEYFRRVDDRKPNLGCSEITPLTCNSTKDQDFITLKNIKYFNSIADMDGKRKRDSEMEEEYLDQVPGMPNRFSYQELKSATENFSKKLGEGGYGSVFEGTLGDGTKIAVKCLEGFAHVKKSFLAEVQSIGSIHHVNLVRLRGFCTWRSQRLLVYEFMSNGSLDRWIYHEVREHILEWEYRKKIILDIAKAKCLAYLHEDCRKKIVHLDTKPQNILLDNDFNAKVSDFGLSMLTDKSQTEVMTTIKGTFGYIVPEWQSSIITKKLDVYSFGIVLLEILCVRKIFDRSILEEKFWGARNIVRFSLQTH